MTDFVYYLAVLMDFAQDIHGIVELPQFERSLAVDGVLVTVRCFYIANDRPHYELWMSGRDERGIIDVARDRELQLDREIEEAAVCFATSVRLRQKLLS